MDNFQQKTVESDDMNFFGKKIGNPGKYSFAPLSGISLGSAVRMVAIFIFGGILLIIPDASHLFGSTTKIPVLTGILSPPPNTRNTPVQPFSPRIPPKISSVPTTPSSRPSSSMTGMGRPNT